MPYNITVTKKLPEKPATPSSLRLPHHSHSGRTNYNSEMNPFKIGKSCYQYLFADILKCAYLLYNADTTERSPEKSELTTSGELKITKPLPTIPNVRRNTESVKKQPPPGI